MSGLAETKSKVVAQTASFARFSAKVSSILRSSDGDGVPVDGVFEDEADVDGMSVALVVKLWFVANSPGLIGLVSDIR